MATPVKGSVRVKCQGPGCGKTFQSKRADRKFCSDTCRSRSRRGGSQAVGDSELVKAVKAELREAGKLASVYGQLLVKIATQLDGAGPAQTASLSREFDRVRALLLGPDKPPEPPPGEAKPAEPEPEDELTRVRRARDAKLAALREAAD